MALPIVSAVAPTVISSATDSEGFVNQAFKITILIGLALAVATGIFLIYQLTNIFNDLSGLLSSTGNIGLLFTGFLSPIGLGITALTSGFMR